MKTLLILRHAKSSWDNADLADFDRPLNSRGRQAAPFIGEMIRERRMKIDLILSSPAKRAKQTAILVKETAELFAELRFDEKIYEASPISLLHIIDDIESEIDTVLLVGHNPGLEGLIKILTGGIQPMPTAALAQIELNVDYWHEVAPDCGKLDFIIRPKDEMHSSGAN